MRRPRIESASSIQKEDAAWCVLIWRMRGKDSSARRSSSAPCCADRTDGTSQWWARCTAQRVRRPWAASVRMPASAASCGCCCGTSGLRMHTFAHTCKNPTPDKGHYVTHNTHDDQGPKPTFRQILTRSSLRPNIKGKTWYCHTELFTYLHVLHNSCSVDVCIFQFAPLQVS
jgi:hypothetical protein